RLGDQLEDGEGARARNPDSGPRPRRRGDRMNRRPTLSLPGLTRQSILLRKKMDARVESAHDGLKILGRRDFISLLARAAAAWPIAARAQQSDKVRRIGVLYSLGPDDQEAHLRSRVFEQSLQQLGWTVGRNLQIDYRLAAGDSDRLRRYAEELVALAPDVIMAVGSVPIGPLLQAARAIPIVFANVADPVGAGFVQSLARPGGNATGFTNFEYSMSGKWMELLKQVAPSVSRVAVLRDATVAAGLGQFGAIQTVAQSLGVDLTPLGVRDADEIER